MLRIRKVRRTLKIVLTVTCCGRKYTLRAGSSVRCSGCGRLYKG